MGLVRRRERPRVSTFKGAARRAHPENRIGAELLGVQLFSQLLANAAVGCHCHGGQDGSYCANLLRHKFFILYDL